jgi:hypothetical protein
MRALRVPLGYTGRGRAAGFFVPGAGPTRTELPTASTPIKKPSQHIKKEAKELPMQIAMLTCLVLATFQAAGAADEPDNTRPPRAEADLRYWLENMVWHHRFSTEEIAAATGLSAEAIADAQRKFHVYPDTKPRRPADAPLLVLPYPGGRHPRIGFLDGAVRPQRETKISVFTPWDETAYVVDDVPEAIWHDTKQGPLLLYLAHTHVPTLWTRQGIELEKLEWERHSDGTLSFERRLPNGVRFGTYVRPGKDAVRMEQWLTNGTDRTLTGLRVQNCVMLKGAPEFAQLTDENKVLRAPYAACRSPDDRRWVITAWVPCFRPWANAKVPCLHSDPQFPDCPPGETSRLRGWLSFYEGADLDAEIKRIEATGWREADWESPPAE